MQKGMAAFIRNWLHLRTRVERSTLKTSGLKYPAHLKMTQFGSMQQIESSVTVFQPLWCYKAVILKQVIWHIGILM